MDILGLGESDLTTALLKTKVLLHKMGEKKLLEWVNGELQGYNNNSELPDYRIVPMVIRGHVSNGYYRATNQTLPVMHLREEIKKQLTVNYLNQSIAVIKEYIEMDNLQKSIAPEYYGFLSKGLGNNYQVETAWGEPPAGYMVQIITEVRSRLLDFILELSDKFPEELDTEVMRIKSKEIGVSKLFNNTVFGDNTTIVVGDSNTQSVSNNIVKNDIESLKNTLKKHNVGIDDINGLTDAIKKDEGCLEHNNKHFGKNVSEWIGKMMTKAASNTWSISIGAAGNILATAIESFYGFNV